MTPESVKALSALCSRGSDVAVVVEENGRKTRIKGKFIQFSDDGLTFETDVSTRHLSCAAILDFEVFRNGGNAPAAGPAAPKPGVDRGSTDPQIAFLSGKIALEMPAPDFALPRFPAEYRQQLNRWKNRFDYALKVNELTRLSDDVAEIARLAEKLVDFDLYALAGSLSIVVSDVPKARKYLHEAAALGSSAAAMALAALASREKDWRPAAEHLVNALLLQTSVGARHREHILMLGRCVAKLQDREVRGIAPLTEKCIGSPTEELMQSLLSFALLRKNPAAAHAALFGDLESARSLAPDSEVFQRANVVERRLQSAGSGLGPSMRGIGRVSSYYLDKEYGFAVDDIAGTNYQFRLEAVLDRKLQQQLITGETGQAVMFRVVRAGSRTMTGDVDEVAAIDVRTEQAAAKPSRAAAEMGSSAYGRAKQEENRNRPEAAERLYREEIRRKGKFRHPATMDLISLLRRLNRIDDALALMDQSHKDGAEPMPDADRQIAQALTVAGRYREAYNVYQRMLAYAHAESKPLVLRQVAYCAFMQKDFETALHVLRDLQAMAPGKVQVSSLIELVKKAGSVFTAFSYTFSPFASALLENPSLDGLEHNARGKTDFEESDFVGMEKLLDDTEGRRASMRAKYLLTLAAMAMRSPEAAGQRTAHHYMWRHFLLMGEAAMYDENLQADTCRFYLSESLLLSGEAVPLEITARYLLASYLPAKPRPSDLNNSRALMARMADDPLAWSRFETDFPYYCSISEALANRLVREVAKYDPPGSLILDQKRLEYAADEEKTRLREEYAQLQSFAAEVVNSVFLQNLSKRLRDLAPSTRFALDKERLMQMALLADDAGSYLIERGYSEKETYYVRVTQGLETLRKAVAEGPSKLSAELLVPIAERVEREVKQNFDQFAKSAEPVLTVNDALASDHYRPGADGRLRVRLVVSSKAGGAPVDGICVSVGGATAEQTCESPEVMHGGESREIEVSVAPGRLRSLPAQLPLRVKVKYRTKSGGLREIPGQDLPIRVEAPGTLPAISNPYQRYSGGKIVHDPEMFFGRQALLDRISREITSDPIGHCYAIYGQKRSGKSSFIAQLDRKVKDQCFSVYITLGFLDKKDANASFARWCIQPMEDGLSELGIIPAKWPLDAEMRAAPADALLAALRETSRALRLSGRKEPRIVLFVDEFTYLYEYIKQGDVPAEFMRYWKALLETRMFSAVVVGQDTMPKFIHEFQNEFAVFKQERITYLSDDEATKLVQVPILWNGKSRFRGSALRRLLQLTAGSPYYIQKFCDRLVQHLNDAKAEFITQIDVDAVARGMICGKNQLADTDFDPLITAAGESVADAPRHVYLSILRAIAEESGKPGGAKSLDFSWIPNSDHLVEDLRNRGVIDMDPSGRLSIRVSLFAEWLRVNRDTSSRGSHA